MWVAAVLLFALQLCICRNGETAKISKESAVKAAFVYKFLLFTDFPDQAFSSPRNELSLCIYGPSVFNGAFDPVKGKLIKGRLLKIRRIEAQSGRIETEDCHILFISSKNSPDPTRHALSMLKGAPILTVGEHKDFLTWGGMIRLYIDRGRVAFDVNADSARVAGISFRAQMLRIAKQVMENER